MIEPDYLNALEIRFPQNRYAFAELMEEQAIPRYYTEHDLAEDLGGFRQCP